ncbi:MAG: glycosyl transferase family 1 [Gammaproteobacteria bacterium]|nr:MAG: glycosyl transferase family 1 [Gammaproteobacteria bacterium]PHR83242.1 MAG: glycosyl transferase family 1 [Colwellia sp.]
MEILVFTRATSTINQFRPEAEIYCKMAELGHKVTIITDAIPEQLERFKQAGVRVIPHKVTKKISLNSIKLIRQELSQYSYDIVYACCSKTIPNAAFACVGFNVQLIVYRGTSGGMYRTDPSNYLCMLHPRINGVVCVSSAVTKNVKNKVRSSIKNNIRTIYKGHDLAWYQDSSADLSKLGSNQKYFNVLCIGSNRPHKGLMVMLNAAEQLADIKELRIILVGKNFNCEPYQSKIMNSGMAERILQPGFRSDAPAIAKACDLVILPSIGKEGLSRVILEALSNGTPVVSSANDGAVETIENDINGYLVPIGDAKAIADKIRMLNQDRQKLKQLAAHSTDIIKTKMSHTETVKNMLNFFQDLASKNKG